MSLVSFVVPAFNAQDYIAATLGSLLTQTYPHVEIIVVDDGSTDRTASIVGALTEQHASLRLIQQTNSGVAAARNRGIEEARGSLIAPVDADDIWYRRAAERFVHRLQTAGDRTAVAYAWSAYLDEAGRPTGGYRASMIRGFVAETLLCHNFIGHASATMIRRSALDNVGWYDVSFHQQGQQGCEDWDLYLRLADEYSFEVVPEWLVGYRKPACSMSAHAERMISSHERMLEKWYTRHPSAPQLFGQLSRSSFALYLAQESRRRGDRSAAARWARTAWQACPSLTWLRPAWHLCRWMPGGPPALMASDSPAAPTLPTVSAADACPLRLSVKQRWRLRLLLGAQSTLHRSVRGLTPQTTCFERSSLDSTPQQSGEL